MLPHNDLNTHTILQIRPWLLVLFAGWFSHAVLVQAQPRQRPYRLTAVDLKQPVIWGATCLQPEGRGLSFGGQHQDAVDGRPHTRMLIDGKWQSMLVELRRNNPNEKLHQLVSPLAGRAKRVLAAARAIYFKGLTREHERSSIKRHVIPKLRRVDEAITSVASQLPGDSTDSYARQQAGRAKDYLAQAEKRLPKFADGISAASLRRLLQARIRLELAAEALAAEPPPRAMNCGEARLRGTNRGKPGNTLVYDSKTKLYVMFGGDHLDYLTNDTWSFDPARRRWFQSRPAAAPPPRANHRLAARGDGKIRLTGGYTYSSNTDYVGGQYMDLDDGEWIYDIAQQKWTGGKLVPSDSRVYRTGPFHPNYYLRGPKPDAARFERWLQQLPVNRWVATRPAHLPRLNRDWGTARIDPHRDMMLRWSGGHSAHGGTDVLHFHFSTNRWELPFAVEFPLGQLYSNTSYPNGFNFNLRPWMTGHTYQNYDYDLPSRKMIKAGRPRNYYLYDPDLGDWVGRGRKPATMQYNSCFYTLTLTSTPQGVICWDKNGRVHHYKHSAGKWIELKTNGDKLPGAYVDNSTIAYDSKRQRVLMVNTGGYRKSFDGRIWALDLKTKMVKALTPRGREHARRFANVDKCCYDAAHDWLLMGTYLKGSGDHTPTPAYDCRTNRWVTLNIAYSTGKRFGRTTRAFPHRRSDGLMFDARRNLIWGTNANSQVFVLRIDRDRADVKTLQ